jgi:hypothetical protein
MASSDGSAMAAIGSSRRLRAMAARKRVTGRAKLRRNLLDILYSGTLTAGLER